MDLVYCNLRACDLHDYEIILIGQKMSEDDSVAIHLKISQYSETVHN